VGEIACGVIHIVRYTDRIFLRLSRAMALVVAVDERIYKQWFAIADTDQDGRLTGADAVKFFQRSGLAREQLSRVRSGLSFVAWRRLRAGAATSPRAVRGPRCCDCVCSECSPRPLQVWNLADNARQGYLGYNEFVKARASRSAPQAARSARSAGRAMLTPSHSRRCAPSPRRSATRSSTWTR